MNSFNLSGINTVLTSIEGKGVSFTGKSAKWENAEDAKSLIEEIKACKNLIFLNLEGNSLGVDAAKAIGEALKAHPEFTDALWKDLFTGRLKSEIPLALKALGEGIIAAKAKLSIIDCSDNALGPNGMVGLVDLLKSPACYSLKTLKLNNCGLGIQGGKMLAQALLTCYEESKKNGTPLQLKVFEAGRNRLENAGATALAGIFETLKSLEVIAMPQNGIYHPGISAIAKALNVNTKMRILNLNDNTITSIGAEALAPAIANLNNLQEINFGDCLLKTNGAISIASALAEEHTTLEILNLEYNEISSRGGRVISASLENKPNLKEVHLNGNKFSKTFCEEISMDMAALDKAEALKSLDENDDVDEDEEGQSDDEDEDEEDYEEEEDEEDEDDDDAEYEDEEDEIDEENEGAMIRSSKNSSINTTLDNSTNKSTSDESNMPSTIESFVRLPNPSENFFNSIKENNKLAGFRKFLLSIPKESYIVYTVFTILKLSSISQTSKEALEISNELFKDVFDFATKANKASCISHFFLIQLGLLKTEEKLFRPSYNLKACRSAIKYAIDKKSIPDNEIKIFQCFFENFNQ